jgi:adenylosuccinate lyase
MIIAEPLYIILASKGHPDAHETVRKLTLKAEAEDKKLRDLIKESQDLKPYLNDLTERQQEILYNPESYTGIAENKTETIVKEIKDKRDLN